MEERGEEHIQETLRLLGKMNGLAKELLLVTNRLRDALNGRNVEASARAMDLRQGILGNAGQLREQISRNLDSVWKGVPLPQKIVSVLEESRETLELVHKLEKECMTLASGCRDEIKDQLGQVRAVRKMKVSYGGGGKRRSTSPKLIKKRV
jgi:hypothetical protein